MVGMEPIAPAYISDVSAQIGSLSAFLGGFAATFVATLLTMQRADRLMTATITLAVISAVAFIVAVTASTMQVAIYHPDGPPFLDDFPAARIRTTMLLAFLVGTLTLLAGLGCSGWIRSSQLGWITTFVSAFGAATVIVLTLLN
jgi:MFS superfamily sulfate permease-like transporter